MQTLQQTQSAGIAGAQALPRLLGMKEVQSITGGKSRSTIWRWAKDSSNKFPAPIKISGHSVAWPEESIIAWRESLMSREAV